MVSVFLGCWLGRSDLTMQLLKKGNSQSRLPFKSSNFKNDDKGKTIAITTTTKRERERLREEYIGTVLLEERR